MKINKIILILLIGLITATTLFFSRQIFFFRYDPEYFENYYYNSQWNVPQSTRGISDGELYKFVGYRLVQGQNPFYLNYEVPPFAKHLYGLAEYFIGNPYWISLGFYFLAGTAIYFLCLELFASGTTALLGLLLFVTTPFLATQIGETMLDLPLTSLFLVHGLFLVRYFKRLKFKDLVLAGIFLGLATGTKIGVYTPFTLLLGLILTFLSSKKFKDVVLYFILACAGYVLSFASYFIHHPNPIPWLRLHEKPFSFYLSGMGGTVDYLNQWRGIFLNTYQGFWVGGAKTGLGDWSPILPLGVILAVYILFINLKKKDYSWIYLSLFTFGILAVNTALPFWARYLMPVVPLLILFILYAFRKFSPAIILLAVINLMILLPIISTRNLSGHAGAVERFLNTRAYREMYRSIDSDTRAKYPEKEFQQILEKFYVTMRIKKIEVTISDIVDTKDVHQGKLSTRYFSDYGDFSNTQNVDFTVEHNQWKTIWQWNYLWPGFDPAGKVEIKNTSSKPLTKAQRAVYVIPRLMYDWGKSTFALQSLTKMDNQAIDKKIREVIPDDFPRFVGYLDPGVDPDTIKKSLLPGITVEEESPVFPGSIIFSDAKGKVTSLPIKGN